MSSETSTDTFQPWQLFTLAGLIGATVVVFVSRGETPAGIILLSLIIFAAAIVGYAAWRTFAPFAGAEDPTAPQMLGGRTRAALEREKTLVLRAIKDLEFDRAMGKISEKDFTEMSARLRLRAAGLIRQLDAGAGYRQEIQRELEARLAHPSHVGRTLSGSPSAPVDRGEPDKVRPTTCTECNVQNDADARFCKNCGSALKRS